MTVKEIQELCRRLNASPWQQKVLYEELTDTWHTGTPTEEGWYLIAYREFPNTPIKYAVEPFENSKWLHFTVDRLSWQKIEPYKED